MSGEIARWLSSGPVERQRSRELAALDHQGELAEAQIEIIGRATKRATFETLGVHMMKKQAEALAPDGAELYTMIAIAGAVECTKVIEGMNRRRGYGR
jgi:hypothetical protein